MWWLESSLLYIVVVKESSMKLGRLLEESYLLEQKR